MTPTASEGADWAGQLRSINQAFAAREEVLAGQLRNAVTDFEQARSRVAELEARNLQLAEERDRAVASERQLIEEEAQRKERADEERSHLHATLLELQARVEDLRQWKLGTEAERDAMRCDKAALEEAKAELETELAARQSHWNHELQQLTREQNRSRAQLERLLDERTNSAKALQDSLADVRVRHERQVAAFIEALEDANRRLDDLTRQATSANKLNARDHLHWRFARATTHPLLTIAFSLQDRLDSTMEAIMDAPLFTRTNYQPAFTARADGAYSLEDFLVLHDRSFVNAAYLAILRREADPDGATFYLQQVRSGVSKAKVLDQILRSDEANKHRTVIHGLRSHLRFTRLCELPLIGNLVSAVVFLATVNSHLRGLRVLENHVIRIAEEAQVMHESNMHKLRSMIERRGGQ